MSDFFERHLAAARCYQDGEGTASAALCKFHNDTAAEIERLTARLQERDEEIERLTAGSNKVRIATLRNEHLMKRFGYLEGDWERRNHIIESLTARIAELEAELDVVYEAASREK